MDGLNTEKWKMYRAIFYNFWYYPNQELIFKDGCAVLRGHNGSGKSVTTQSLITVVLDGDTSSRKLDPFGGRERKISDTVLGEKELTGINHRIGYIALEFKKGETGVTKTIGLGIEADRDKKQPKIWYYIINGKRIGDKERDLKLYITEKVDGEVKSIPLNEKELRMEIEGKLQCGKVYNHRDEYASMVNKQLFGFENLESYKGLINLLMEARSPKLSDQNKPEAAAEVLSKSLPQLTEEELRPLTSSIESIDRLEKDLVTYKRDLKAIGKLNDVYQEYNEVAFAEKADAFLKSYKQYETTKKKVQEEKKKLDKNKMELESVQKEIRKTNDELDVYKTEKADLGVEEIESVQNRKEEQTKKRKEQKERYESLSRKKESAKKTYLEYQSKFEQYDLMKNKAEKELEEFLVELQNHSQEIEFESHSRFFEHFVLNKKQEDYSFEAWESALKEYKNTIGRIRLELEKYEQIKKEIESLENVVGNLRMKIDESQKNIDAKEEEHENEILRVQQEILYWMDQTKALIIPKEVESFLVGNLEEVFDEMEKDEYLKPLHHYVSEKRQEIQQDIVRLTIEMENEDVVIQSIHKDLQEWKNEKEVEPNFVLHKKQNWGLLKENEIKFQPFYEAFEFKKNISTEKQIEIQNALFETGILSSVVVEKENLEKASQYATVLNYGIPKNKNLSEILVSAENQAFNEVLKGISFEVNEDGYILGTGSIQTNFVKGQSSLYSENVFIGKTARETYRQKKIKELQNQIAIHEQARQELTNSVHKKKEWEKALNEDEKQFPNLDSLKVILREMETEKFKINNVLEPSVKENSEKISLLSELSKEIMKIIKKQIDFTELNLDVKSFGEELNRIEEYGDCLQDIKNSYKDKESAKKHTENYKEQADKQLQYEDDYHSDMMDAEAEIEKLEKSITSLTKRLQELGETDILLRVEELSTLINETIPKKLKQLHADEQRLKMLIENAEKQITFAEENEIPFEKTVYDAWEKAFGEQIRLGFVIIDERCNTLIEKAKWTLEKYGQFIDKTRTILDRVKDRLNKRYQKQMIDLPNYDLEMETRESEFTPVFDTQDEMKIQYLNFIKEQMTRIVITLEMDETRVSPAVARDRLSKRIDELEMDATEKDRQLYQDILINTLGDKIRRKIQYVENWEKEMNKFMEHENIIKFRIKWVPKKTDKEGELDTKALVESLKKDSRWIDIDEIANHFRSKIKEAKRRYENENDANLQEIMKQVLDYRSWFEFEIYFTKKGDKEKRLNRNSYGELSGGQRVLAMVTPVLAALYAKYTEGRADAPKIFTLDEAFARVDDENINVMFEYIYKLGFNYILNSQALWGCFESVPSLNIYELSRPDNRPFVAIQSYYWNGNKVKRVDEEWFEKEKEEKEKEYATISG